MKTAMTIAEMQTALDTTDFYSTDFLESIQVAVRIAQARSHWPIDPMFKIDFSCWAPRFVIDSALHSDEQQLVLGRVVDDDVFFFGDDYETNSVDLHAIADQIKYTAEEQLMRVEE